MKKLIFLFLFIASSFLFGQTGTVLKARTVYEDTTRVLSTNYGTLDTVHNKSREKYYRPVHLDSTLRGLQGFEFVGTSDGMTYQSGARTTLFWMPSKWAFRAGLVTGTAWDNSNIGSGSVAFGGNNISLGDYSFSTGNSNTSYGTGSSTFGAGNIDSGSYSIAGGFNNLIRSTASYSSTFGNSNIVGGDYSFLGGHFLETKNVDYVNLFGANIIALRQTLGGFAWSNGGDTLRFGHATVSYGVPFVASAVGAFSGGDELNSFALFSDQSADTSSFRWAQSLGQTGVGGTTTTSLDLIKSRNTSASNYDKWDGTKYIILQRFDTSNNIYFNAAKTSDFNYGNMFLSNGNFTINTGRLDVTAGGGAFGDTVIVAKNSSGTAYPQLTIRDDYTAAGTASAGISFIRSNAASTDFSAGNHQGTFKIFSGLNLLRFGEGTTQFTLNGSGNGVFTGNLATGNLTTYGSYGVPNIVDTIDYTVSSDIAAVNIAGTATGWFRFNYSLKTTTADVTAGTIQLSVTSNDGSATTDLSAAVSLIATTNRDRGSFLIFNSSGNIQFSTAVTGAYGTSAYRLRAWVERVL